MGVQRQALELTSENCVWRKRRMGNDGWSHLETCRGCPAMSGIFFDQQKPWCFCGSQKPIFCSCIDARPIHTSIQHSYLSSYLMLSIYYMYLGKCKHTRTSTHAHTLVFKHHQKAENLCDKNMVVPWFSVADFSA